MRSSEPFNHFVDDYLAYLHEVHPTSATLDGVHTHDDLLEDLSRQGIEQDTRALSGFARRLQDINAGDLTPVERAEQPMVASNIQARMFELEHTRTWERNPQLYADTICAGIAGQVVFSHASLPERARRVLSKLRQTRRLVQAARDNIKDPPGIFVKVGLETFRGALKFIHEDLPKAFSALDDMHLLGDLAEASTEAAPGIVAPPPDFYRWSFASMWVSGPFEPKPTSAYYYLTDADPSWSAEKQNEHLRDFNYPTLWSISIHEVFPGHFLHFQHLRKVESKVRKSIMFSPASFVEGWAHYCEQMMVESGFRRQDHTLRLGQLAEALIRLARFVVSIRLHVEDW